MAALWIMVRVNDDNPRWYVWLWRIPLLPFISVYRLLAWLSLAPIITRVPRTGERVCIWLGRRWVQRKRS